MNGTPVRAGDGTPVRAGDGTKMNGGTVRAGDMFHYFILTQTLNERGLVNEWSYSSWVERDRNERGCGSITWRFFLHMTNFGKSKTTGHTRSKTPFLNSGDAAEFKNIKIFGQK